MNKRILLSSIIAIGALVAALSTTPSTAIAEEADRCSGNATPLCRKIETCVAIPATDTQVCTRSFFYFPNAE